MTTKETTNLTAEERTAIRDMVVKNDVGRVCQILAELEAAVSDKYAVSKGVDIAIKITNARHDISRLTP